MALVLLLIWIQDDIQDHSTKKEFVLEINIKKVNGITRVQRENSECPFPLYIPPFSEFCFKTELNQSLMARDDVKLNQWLAA